MKSMAFAGRTAKEILRDPMTLCFGLGFPVGVLLLLSAIGQHVPSGQFAISALAPGMAVFGLSFVALFAAMLLAKDRSTSFLTRLYTTPMTASAFLAGYAAPLLPIAMAQTAIVYLMACVLGMPMSANVAFAWLCSLPTALFFMAVGLLCGALFTEKQASGLCGALLTNATAWLSGAWFPTSLAGGVFEAIANVLPFAHAVELGRAALSGSTAALWPHLLWVVGYAAVFAALAVWAFARRMRI